MFNEPEVHTSIGTAGRLRGLDGLRGLAVVAVVAFHFWPTQVPGGFIGVSTFFTLSGFVITRGLLAEQERTGSIALRAFWARRVRRLWPAASITLAAIAVVWAAASWSTRSLGRDLFASFAQVANWRFLYTGSAYGATESPVAHYWSLAIEEQLYLAVPVLVWLLRRWRWATGAALTTLIAGSVALTAQSAGDAPVVYYSTFTRAAELLLGALLAVVMQRLPARVPRPIRTSVGVLGAGALVVLAWLCVRTSLGTTAYYRGGLTVVGAVSAVAVVGAIWSPTVVRALAIRPLLWLGSVSYGIYLIHWPVHLALTKTQLTPWLQPWVALAIVGVLAPLSFRWVEEPVRTRRMPRRVALAGATSLCVVVLGLSTVVTTARPRAQEINFAAAVAALDAQSTHGMAPPPPDAAPSAPRPLRVGVFGDSTAATLFVGISAAPDDRVRILGGSADLGCPLGRTGDLRGNAEVGNLATAPPATPPARCDWANWVDVVQRAGGLDAMVVLIGNWDIAGRRIPALNNRWATVGDAEYDDWLLGEMAAVMDAVHRAGARSVVWMKLPVHVNEPPNARVDRFNELVELTATTRPWITVVDYPSYLRDTGRDAVLRPDGVHLTAETAAELARTWLFDQIVAAQRA